MSQSDPRLLCEIDSQGVGTITLNRPKTHNAFDDILIDKMRSELSALEQNPTVKIIVIKSVGKSFSAGADLSWMQRMAKSSHEENVQDAIALSQLMYSLYLCPKPTLAVVQGPAFGGGIGLVACCQIVLASDLATFGFSEAKLGLIPSVISPYIINSIGVRQTHAHFLLGTTIDAHRALTMGLCHEVVAHDQLTERAQQLIQTLLKNGPQALLEINHLIKQLHPFPIGPEIMLMTAEKIASLRQSPEGSEGIAAFLEKRQPNWAPVKK